MQHNRCFSDVSATTKNCVEMSPTIQVLLTVKGEGPIDLGKTLITKAINLPINECWLKTWIVRIKMKNHIIHVLESCYILRQLLSLSVSDNIS